MSDEQPTRPDSHTSASASDSSGLKGLTTALGIEPAEPGHDPLRGCSIGGVTIVRLIAEGGMGRVYEGKQEKPNRTVAVKVMRPGLTSPSVLKRFEYEAEVLGRLQHPGIAHIYSVGMHRVGNASVPYFVMEYIADAKTLTKYAEDLKLPTRQRLDLFQSVCDAVAHGHQKGVIHRDLKPSNILVDATGQPKVIDFGVARATDSDMALTTMQTDVGQLLGTLQYMSPEQFDANPNDIDIRSDVYALGVVLYELLAGKPPYDVKKKAIFEVARIVKEEDPKPLSSFNRALRGDVAVITGKCLEKDRGRRYSSASELGADIGRHLTGEPIAANPPGFLDGLVRLARKHRAAAFGVAGVFTALVIAVIGIGVFANRVDEARRRAEAERASAEQARAAAEQARAVAEQSRQEAEAAENLARNEKEIATQRLYEANLYRLAQSLRERHYTLSRSLYQEIAAPFASKTLPIELACLQTQMDQAAVVYKGHEAVVQTLAFSPDGNRIATGSEDKTIRLWNAMSGEQIAVCRGHHGNILSLAFSPDGTRLATAAWNGRETGQVRVWDAMTGKQLAVFGGQNKLNWIFLIAFSPDGTRLATGSSDHTARIWDADSGEELAVLEGHVASVTVLAFSPDGMRLATGSSDKDYTARLWDVTTGKQVAVLEGHERRILHLAFSPDGSRLATGADDSTVRLWDVSTAKEIATLKGAGGWVSALAFSPDSARIATACSLATEPARLWDAVSGKQLAVLDGHLGIGAVAFSPDGTRLATGSWAGTVRLVNATTLEQVAIYEGHVAGIKTMAFSPDSAWLATASHDRTARLWEAAGEKAPGVLQESGGRSPTIAFNPRGTWLAVGAHGAPVQFWDPVSGAQLGGLESRSGVLAISCDGARIATVSHDRLVCIWDAVTGKKMSDLKGHHGRVRTLTFSPGGMQIATGAEDGKIRIWDVPSAEMVMTLEGHENAVAQMAFSPDGKRIAAGDTFNGRYNSTARLWDAMTGKQVAVLDRHKLTETRSVGIETVTFSPDGSLLATGSQDQTACIWEAVSGKEVAMLKGHMGAIWSVVFSPDGRRLATASSDKTVRLWDTTSGQELAVLEGHVSSVHKIAFSSDGTRLATGSSDKTVRLWDLVNGKQLAVLEGASGIAALAFSPDGTRLATGSYDGMVRLWGASNAQRHQARLRSAEIENRLGRDVSAWLKSGEESTVESLRKAKLTPEEYRVAANMVLRRCVAERSDRK